LCFVDKARAPLNPAEEALDDSVNEDDRMRNAWAFNAVKADILTKSVVFYEEFGEIRGYSKNFGTEEERRDGEVAKIYQQIFPKM